MTYFNELDAYPVQWLRNLYPAATVDDRSIADVQPSDLAGHTRAHFFAGIGGWELALDLAGWPADWPVWTGSCPCQPFSAAGKRGGGSDDRHLWPTWYRLIRECRPVVVFGEQVEGAIGHGWLDAVFTDLEAEGYTCGAAVLGAHSVGAPHMRQRLYWVAYAVRDGHAPTNGLRAPIEPPIAPREEGQWKLAGSRDADGLADAGRGGLQFGGGLGPPLAAAGRNPHPWDRREWIECRDGATRPTQPGLCPLAHGIPARASKLRAYGNAIVPQVAAEFIAAFMDVAP